jgi:hypothetical protein
LTASSSTLPRRFSSSRGDRSGHTPARRSTNHGRRNRNRTPHANLRSTGATAMDARQSLAPVVRLWAPRRPTHSDPGVQWTVRASR